MTSANNDPPSPAGFTRRYVDFLARHDLAIAAGAFVLFVLSLLAASRLELRSDFAELLPHDDPEVGRLQQIGDRIGAPATLVIAIQGPDPAANERFADALVKNLTPLMATDLRGIDVRADAAQPFFEHNKALYADLIDLARIDDDLGKLLLSRKNPAFITFADGDKGEEDDDPDKDLKRLEKKLEQRKKEATAKFPSGYYESKDRSLLAIVTWTRSSGTGDQSGFRILSDVQRVIDQTRPEAFGRVSAQLTGDVPSAIAEHDALKSDIETVSLVCTVLVLLVIILYYRSGFSLGYIFFPTLLGVAVAFGITALTIGYLNTNTAFLGSIILGNGINFGIILLARFREERIGRPGESVEDVLARALSATAKPTLAAALAAGIAYGSLALTRFRGFQQFGVVGGIGMILCWLATYSYCPVLIHLRERFSKRRPAERQVSSGVLIRFASGLLARRTLLMVIVSMATVVAAVSLSRVIRNPFEYDFSKLRNQRSRKHGAGDLYVRVGSIFPQDISPVGVALLPTVEDAPLFRTALLEKDCADALARGLGPKLVPAEARPAECARRVAAGEPTGGLLSAVSTVYDYLPKDQDAKLALIAKIRKRLADPTMDLLSPDEKKQVNEWAPPPDLRRLSPTDLPEPVARRFREIDGTVGRVALLFPVRVWANWDGRSLIRLSDIIRDVHLPNGHVVNAAGHPSLFAAMLRSIVHDGPIATLAALIGVVVLVVLLFRQVRSAGLVLLSLIVGVIWMSGAAAAMDLKLNFLNFVALPITLGIGVDYAVNVFARLAREPAEQHAHALAETGSAVILCSTTTMIGYSSLLIASNGALRSFGKLADLGEAGSILAALLLVPLLPRVAAMRRRTAKPARP
jgi:predicted RND superfamily exporter protein